MANYTQSIREILQLNKTQSENLVLIEDVYNIANRAIFNQSPVNVINDDYRKQFITGFTLHYMNDEIGLETLPLWKIALSEKLYNYGSYINLIYENLDKQVFADYRVRQATKQGEHSIDKTGTGTIENVKDEDTTTTETDTINRTETITDSEDITTAETGTDTNVKTGTDMLDKTGTDTTLHTGTDADAHTGTQATAESNTQNTQYDGTKENTGHTDNDHNLIQIQSDTPMGSLSNLRTPGGQAKGLGVNYANGQTYNYMSGAQEVDESNVQTDNLTETDANTQDVTGSSDSTTTYNDTVTKTKNLSDAETLALKDTTTYNNTNTETKNLQDTTNKTGESERTGGETKSTTGNIDGTTTDTQTRNVKDTEEGTNTESEEATDYTLNNEMLLRSIPLLNKVWEIFDDIFMQIY